MNLDFIKSDRTGYVYKVGRTSPMEKIENYTVELLKQCGEMNCPLTCGLGLDLINSLIGKDETKDEVKKWIEHNCPTASEGSWDKLGQGYGTKFMKRHKHELKSKKGKMFPQSRSDWCTYENFVDMYDRLYAAMSDSKVAKNEMHLHVWIEMVMW